MKTFAIWIILILLYTPLKSQDTLQNLFAEEKFSIEAGVGIHNGVLGFRTKYFFSDYVGGSAGFGMYVLNLVWNVGLEFRVPRLFNNTISPYFLVVYGTNAAASLNAGGGVNRVDELFTGVSIGAGVKLNLIKKWNTYLSLGTNYRFLTDESVKFIENYNDINNTNFDTEINNFLPAMGLTYCF